MGPKSMVSLHTTWQGVWRWRCCIIMSARWKQAIIWSCDYILPKHAVTPLSYQVVGCLQASVSPVIVGTLRSISRRSLSAHIQWSAIGWLSRKKAKQKGRQDDTKPHSLINYLARCLSFPIFLFSFAVQCGHAVTFLTPQHLNHTINNYKRQWKSAFWHMQQTIHRLLYQQNFLIGVSWSAADAASHDHDQWSAAKILFGASTSNIYLAPCVRYSSFLQ